MGTTKAQEEQCSYTYKDGTRCAAEIEGQGQFCFWHDPAANKESPDVKDRLQQWARSNRSLEGILLRYAQLEGIKLGGSKGLDLSNADLFRANLKKARLTNVSLRDANLVKADLSRSRLSQVNIQNANLTGVQLRGAKLDRVDWGAKRNRLAKLEERREQVKSKLHEIEEHRKMAEGTRAMHNRLKSEKEAEIARQQQILGELEAITEEDREIKIASEEEKQKATAAEDPAKAHEIRTRIPAMNRKSDDADKEVKSIRMRTPKR